MTVLWQSTNLQVAVASTMAAADADSVYSSKSIISCVHWFFCIKRVMVPFKQCQSQGRAFVLNIGAAVVRMWARGRRQSHFSHNQTFASACWEWMSYTFTISRWSKWDVAGSERSSALISPKALNVQWRANTVYDCTEEEILYLTLM